MKKSVYYSGIACIILMLLGCMFKIMHWPGANMMLIVSVFLFCLYFLPIALMSSYKSQNSEQYKTLHIITYIVFSICVMGVLFKVMHWPGASIFLMIGLPAPFVIFLPAYLYFTKSDKNENTINFLGIMFGLIFLAIFSVLLALGISKQVLGSAITKVYSNEKAMEFSQSVINDLEDKNGIKKSSDELCGAVDELKCELLKATENDLLCKGKKMISDIDLWRMNQVDNKAATAYVFFEGGTKNKLEDLRIKIGNYREALLTSGNIRPELTELINSLFDTEGNYNRIEIDGEKLNWEQRLFSNKQLIFVLDALTEIQSNVRLVECELLDSAKS